MSDFRQIKTAEEYEALGAMAVVLLGNVQHPDWGGLAIQKDQGDVWNCPGEGGTKSSKELVEGLPDDPDVVGYVAYEGYSDEVLEEVGLYYTAKMLGVDVAFLKELASDLPDFDPDKFGSF